MTSFETSVSSLALASMLASCASFAPEPLGDLPFRGRIQVQTSDSLKVSVAVPTAAESRAIYGVDLSSKDIQSVWLEVENRGTLVYWFLSTGMDSQHFGPSEAAYAFHREESSRAADMDAHFEALEFKNPILPGETSSGFVLVNLDEGYKAVDVDLICQADAQNFTFAFVDPDFAGDYKRVDPDAVWGDKEIVHVDDLEELRGELDRLPSYTTNKQGSAEGDPLNLVMVGQRFEVFAALVRRGWHATEIVSRSSLWRTVKSFFGGERYRYSPISSLYVYGRHQDFSAQKVRRTVNERNHMRFWQTPIRFRGQGVWVGQISRDIGVKFTLKSPTISTHVIDPDVDETRRYLLEDLAYSQALVAICFAQGTGEVSADEPRFNLVGDPFYTDGYRAVMFFGHRPNTLAEIKFLDWEVPGSDTRETVSE